MFGLSLIILSCTCNTFVGFLCVTLNFQVKQDSYKKPNYVQISVESYSHLTGLEDQVKSYEDQLKSYEDQVKSYDEQVKKYEDQQLVYEDQIKNLEDEVKDLNEQLSAAHDEITAKENVVKQHAKVAEDAVSGMLTSYSYYTRKMLSEKS